MVEIEREAPRGAGDIPAFTTIRAGRVSEIPEGGCKLVAHEHSRVAIFRVDGALHAIDDHCPHEGWSLASGTLEGTVLTCAGHDWQIDVRSGACLTMRKYRVKRFELIVDGDEIWLRLPSARPAAPGAPR
jgi:nitrite reductase/ring-hydroxylating ferredoxin subunit